MRVGNEMGDDGDRLHDRRFDAKTETDDAIVDEMCQPISPSSFVVVFQLRIVMLG